MVFQVLTDKICLAGSALGTTFSFRDTHHTLDRFPRVLLSNEMFELVKKNPGATSHWIRAIFGKE